MPHKRYSSIKTFLSLCLLNLFLLLQFLVASKQLTELHRGGEAELRCSTCHMSLNADVEIVSTDVFIPQPRYLLLGEAAIMVRFVVGDYFFTPGRGPPSLHA